MQATDIKAGQEIDAFKHTFEDLREDGYINLLLR